MISVAVLAGGTSDEKEVSLRSGVAITKALKIKNYDATQIDPAGQKDLGKVLKKYDVVFPAVHGKGGEDGRVQKILEDANISFVGSGSAASELCFDKWRYVQVLKEENITLPETELVNYESFQNSELIKSPFVLKPNDGGSSIDTFIVRDPGQFDFENLQATFERHPEMLLQNLIVGIEITVGVLEDQALPVIEIVPPADQEFDFENKYNGATQELCPPKNIDQSLQEKAQSLALQIHQLTGCRDMSRTDMIVGTRGNLCVLETNTIPGLTDQSLLPKAAAEAGYDMPSLTDKLVQVALQRG